MAVAKSYKNMPQVGEPYELNKRMYVKVDTGKVIKQVRWYTDAEYARMYAEEPIRTKSQKDVLGFTNGYITIFKGATEEHEDWFKASIARYARWWGWYIISTEDVPADLPSGVTPVQLMWNDVSRDNDTLKDEHEVKQVVEELTFDPDFSHYVGKIGDRLVLTLLVKKAIPLLKFRSSATLHVMEDEDGNTFVWTTEARTLEEGKTYCLRGSIKDHRLYGGVCQTILTNCRLVV